MALAGKKIYIENVNYIFINFLIIKRFLIIIIILLCCYRLDFLKNF